jgi:GDP-4-dehydro-6-deoxy-D-mannose reductase
MKALITGVTAFVGSHLADYLIDGQGVEVHGIRRPRSRDEFIRPDVIYHEADVTDQSAVATVVATVKPNYLFHLAAQSFVPLSWQAPRATIETNVLGTLAVLEAVRRESPQTIIHFAGSSEEYGLVHPDECPIAESQPLRPQSPYGVSKIAGDLLCQQYQISHHAHAVITRAFNHTGPRRGEQFVTSKIARQLALIKLGKAKPELVLGNLEAIRDFTDVRDMVRAYWLAVNKCYYGLPYNIGTGVGRQIGAVVSLLKDIADVDCEIKQDPRFMRPSDVPRLECDSALFRVTTGWRPEITFRQTMNALFDYWMERLA